MNSIKPKTYNELMHYTRCLRLKGIIPEIDDDLCGRIYRYVTENDRHKVGVADGNLTFYDGDVIIDTIAAPLSSAYVSIMLSCAALNIERPVRLSSGGDGGVGGNNNNNNNNNS